ncbi:transglutaminase family protein [Gryllotalpicola protaetiae]|uniref:Transglutaminase family protein n=1 Tax=Gryllotalpicola protaetiae TaxID=2419771 RepID=A0A387BKY1_9MICO|nr:transglutaminase family protein [Gryllotalpicola protaetiae]AYG02824.1 transglutaminase family protein [Gryllotalpicola protaetiae]
MRYRVSHRTEYSYDDEVSDSLGIAHLVPRQLPWQEVHSATVMVDPLPDDVSVQLDYFGNTLSYFHVTDGHEKLIVEAVSDITTMTPWYDQAALEEPWELARPLAEPGAPGAWAATEFALESPGAKHVGAARDYAARSLARGRPLGDAVAELMSRIHADFDYDPTATTVTSTVADTLKKRAGVCQDFAHLALACLRSHGLAARYVSGYLATDPPPGKPRVVGADASHAWLAVWVPGSGDWLAVDPTNDQRAGERYVTVAWGRDYGDVAPLKGVIFTEATKSTLRVAVDVAPRG